MKTRKRANPIPVSKSSSNGVPSASGHNRIHHLAGPWKLSRDPANEGKRLDWQRKPPEQDARPAPVPGIIQQVFPDYHGVAWYWTTFHAPSVPKHGSSHAIRFLEVDYFAEVWLNGIFLGNHEGAEFPFELRCGNALRHDTENLLVVRVINPIEEPIDGFVLGDTAHRVKFNRNYMPGTAYNFGGITQDVELIEIDPVRISDIHAQAETVAGAIKLSAQIRNDHKAIVQGQLTVTVRLRDSNLVLIRQDMSFKAPSGESVYSFNLPIDQPKWWSLEDPRFYVVTVDMKCGKGPAAYQDQQMARCGFRELRVENGYFRLNGKRILLRCTLTVNDLGYGEKIPVDHLRRDLIFAKAAGFNTIRFIAGGAYPEQLDLCDEIGLMVYEESYASWYLSDRRLKSEFSDLSKMPERYDNSMLGIVKRDRNHPSVVIWGLLNETYDGPVFRHACNCLGRLRALDDSRLVLLNSGRWDGIITVGSLSNPKSMEWEALWGMETTGGLPEAEVDDQGKCEITFVQGGLGKAEQMVFGDFHKYPTVPYQKKDRDFFKTHASGAKPVFLSENGVGSLLDVINGSRQYPTTISIEEPVNAALLRKQVELLLADWDRFGMSGVYAFPEDMYVDSHRQQARQLRLGLDLIRSNPKICGYSISSLVDFNTGEGFWTFWRELKPGMMETLRDGWASLRWCLFVEPGHVYAGRGFELEAVLANEDVLEPGTYSARLRIFGAPGVVWEKAVAFSVPQPTPGADAPLTVNVSREKVTLDAPSGVYEFSAVLEKGGAAVGGRRKFYMSAAPAAAPDCAVTVLGLGKEAVDWLRAHGVACQPWEESTPAASGVTLVGDLSAASAGLSVWRSLMDAAARGGVVVFLSPLAFKRGEDPVGWLPLERKGECRWFLDWIYHKECVAKSHPIFEGLQDKGVMDWEYYDQVIPHHVFVGQDTPDEVAAAAFATGYQDGSLRETYRLGYAGGSLFAGYRFGNGWFYLNTFPLLENIDRNPAGDRMLLNIISHGQRRTAKVPPASPADPEELFKKIWSL